MSGLNRQTLAIEIRSLDGLCARTKNALAADAVKTVADLCRLTWPELLKIPGIGRTSHAEIERQLKGIGLSLGMRLDGADLPASQKLELKFADMTLRDYFAIHASEADIRPYVDANFAGNRRQARYQFAADMLRAREAKS